MTLEQENTLLKQQLKKAQDWEGIADFYAIKELSIQQGFRIKVLEKELEVEKQVAQNFLEQNVRLIDERDRGQEAYKKQHAETIATIEALQAELKMMPAFRKAHTMAFESWKAVWVSKVVGGYRVHPESPGGEIIFCNSLNKVYDLFTADEAEKNKNHETE